MLLIQMECSIYSIVSCPLPAVLEPVANSLIDIEKVVARIMPLWTTPDNPFICIVVPASMNSPILMNAIIAISAYHYDINETLDSEAQKKARKDGDAGVVALRHKQKVLSLLRKNIFEPEVLRDPATLAACMLMQTFEVNFHLG